MILRKEQQEKALFAYMQNHTVIECEAFVDGINAAVGMINKCSDDEAIHKNN